MGDTWGEEPSLPLSVGTGGYGSKAYGTDYCGIEDVCVVPQGREGSSLYGYFEERSCIGEDGGEKRHVSSIRTSKIAGSSSLKVRREAALRFGGFGSGARRAGPLEFLQRVSPEEIIQQFQLLHQHDRPPLLGCGSSKASPEECVTRTGSPS